MKKEKIFRVFSRMPSMTTERLILRPLTVEDATDYFSYASREETCRYLSWTPHTSEGYTKQYLAYVVERYASGQYYDWAVVEKTSGVMIGTCGFTSFRPASDVGEIGYVFNPDYQGRGYATEAVRAVMSFGFEKLGLHRIEGRYLVENNASRRLMERVGMTYEGTIQEGILVKGKYRSYGICGIVRHDG